MGDTQRAVHERTEKQEELRTIAFRLREIQRLLSARVEQEDRRLEAEGLEPVGDSRLDHGGTHTEAER